MLEQQEIVFFLTKVHLSIQRSKSPVYFSIEYVLFGIVCLLLSFMQTRNIDQVGMPIIACI